MRMKTGKKRNSVLTGVLTAGAVAAGTLAGGMISGISGGAAVWAAESNDRVISESGQGVAETGGGLLQNVSETVGVGSKLAQSTSGIAETGVTDAGQTVMYGIGSTSKVVVTASVMKLADEGRVDLDSPLTDYIPEFEMADERYRKITPRMLLDHSSGLQGSTLVNAMLLGDNDTDNHDHLLSRLKSQRLKAEPGAFSTYCNDGFTLAEILVERVSGMSYTEYLEETFAKPLRLSYMKTPQSGMKDEEVAPVYDGQSGKELPREMANVIGSGGVYATAEDLVRFSQVFMRGENAGAGILSEEALLAMETSTRKDQFNPDGRDTNLLYGLGWDCVDTYPFNRYGLKALVKGGDTSFYHASMTVLPEEHISCAVLSSGGGSAFNQMAVQEILLEYLDEIGRIEREEDESPFGEKEMAAAGSTAAAPEELVEQSGWYAGWDMFEAEVDADGTLTLSSKGGNEGSVQTYRCHEDGRFYGDFGAYIDSSGEMNRGSNGKVGKTALEFRTGFDGRQYLMAGSYEIYPGLGSTAMYLPLAEKVEEKPVSETVQNAWEKVSGREYYMVSDKYTSTSYMTNFMAIPKVLNAPGGYLAFEQSMLTLAALEDENHAGFFLQVPGQVGRDMSDYTMVEKNGKIYLETGSFRMISEESVGEFPSEDGEISIGKDGETVWVSCGENQMDRPVTIDVQGKGAFFLYDHSGKEMACISSSYVLEAGREIRLPKDGRVAFAGEAGTRFQILYAE